MNILPCIDMKFVRNFIRIKKRKKNIMVCLITIQERYFHLVLKFLNNILLIFIGTSNK